MPHVDLGGTWHEASFLLVETYTVKMPSGWRVALDPQPYGELVRVDRGRCRFVIGDQEAVVSAGEIGVLLPGPARLTEHVGDEPLAVTGFGFRVALFGTVEVSGLLGLPVRVPKHSADVDEAIDSVVRHGGLGTPVDALRARSRAEAAIADLVQECGDVSDSPVVQVRPEVRAALDLLHGDPGADWDIAALARSAHLSPKHFARCFRDAVGMPPMAYLQSVRLSRARTALATTSETITRVAIGHGFADAAHFTRAFKRQYGATPSIFRRQFAPRVNSTLLRDKPAAAPVETMEASGRSHHES
jgi:AraC-like DNA-binding protein